MKLELIKNNKEIYMNKDIVNVFKNCLFNKSEGRIRSIAQTLYTRQQYHFYTYALEGKIVGIIGIKKNDKEKIEIIHLAAIDNNFEIKSEMIKLVRIEEMVNEVFAEVELKEDADFYRENDFQVEDFYDRMTTLDKYLCTYKY